MRERLTWWASAVMVLAFGMGIGAVSAGHQAAATTAAIVCCIAGFVALLGE